MLDRKGGIRAHFDHNPIDPETAAEIDKITAGQGAVIATITLHINALVQPIIERVGAN